MAEGTCGVKCLTDIGWLGEKKPYTYTEDNARRVAEKLNADPKEKDTWEARPLPE